MKIHQEDCREILARLPNEMADVVVTGIPFWSAKAWGWPGAIGQESSFTDYLLNVQQVFAQIHNVLHDQGDLWMVAGDCRARPEIFQPARLLPMLESLGWYLRDTFIWVYTLAHSQYQVVMWFQKTPPIARPVCPSEDGMVWHMPLDQGDPVSFPAALVRRCLELSEVKPGGMVLDPFAGSGTVGRVAQSMGLKSILIEGKPCPT